MSDVVKLRWADITRFRELAQWLPKVDFPISAPSNPELLLLLAGRSKNLDFFDKFADKRVEYRLEHVLPPEHLYFRGVNSQALNADLCVAFGGTSSATADACWLAELLAEIVAEERGIVISGGAVGVDSAAHLGALNKEGSTVAVLGQPLEKGLAHAFEASRYYLEKGIRESGGLASEYSEATGTLGERVLGRDRIITALADAFVAIECRHDSATVETAKRAWIQKRKVFAVQWSFISSQWQRPESTGNVQLFREMIAQPVPSRPVQTLKEVGDEFRKIVRDLRK